MMTLVLEDPNAHPIGDEPVRQGDRIIGKTTSAAFGYPVGRPCVLAFLSDGTDLDEGSEVALSIAGQRFATIVHGGAVFDPQGLRMRRGWSGA